MVYSVKRSACFMGQSAVQYKFELPVRKMASERFYMIEHFVSLQKQHTLLLKMLAKEK